MTLKSFVILASLMLAAPAYANHPGERLGEVMEQKEPAFEATGLDEILSLDLFNATGNTVDLVDRLQHLEPSVSCRDNFVGVGSPHEGLGAIFVVLNDKSIDRRLQIDQ